MYPLKPEPRPGAVEVVYAKDQPEYLPLPANFIFPYVETKWKLSLRERISILLRGNLHLTLMTFGQALQPVLLSVDRREDL